MAPQIAWAGAGTSTGTDAPRNTAADATSQLFRKDTPQGRAAPFAADIVLIVTADAPGRGSNTLDANSATRDVPAIAQPWPNLRKKQGQYLLWYQLRYRDGMPSLNVSFTEEELATVRAAAANDEVSLKAFAHAAILSAASEHRRRVAEAARIVAERSAELNRRLA